MADLETYDLNQEAILWPAVGNDRYGGFALGPPVAIKVRWNTVRREVLQPNGNVVAFDASAVVAQKIPVGSHMVLADYDNWFGTGSGSGSSFWPQVPDEEVMEVKNYDETVDLKNRWTFREVLLMRFHNK